MYINEETKMSLRTIEISLQELNHELDLENRSHNNKVNEIISKISILEREKNIVLGGYNLNLLSVAEENLVVEGIQKYYDQENVVSCLNDAIRDISNGVVFLRKQFFGCKNYSQFICQRCDCEYGYGPKHGDIVFSIGLKNKNEKFTENEIESMLYYLNMLKNEDFRKRI